MLVPVLEVAARHQNRALRDQAAQLVALARLGVGCAARLAPAVLEAEQARVAIGDPGGQLAPGFPARFRRIPTHRGPLVERDIESAGVVQRDQPRLEMRIARVEPNLGIEQRRRAVGEDAPQISALGDSHSHARIERAVLFYGCWRHQFSPCDESPMTTIDSMRSD